MVTKNILLNNPERFTHEHIIPKDKLEKALQKSIEKLEKWIDEYGDAFFKSSVNYKYCPTPNNHWVCGMHTGTYILAYEFTKDKKFLNVIERHIDSYKERLEGKIGMSDHDVGFAFSPSCVAAYKALGIECARQIALDAAEYYYNLSYCKKGGFILRLAKLAGDEIGCRTMMDTLLNIPLLFWAGKETGNQEYIDAAISQYKITEKYLIREDASSFHHYQFNPQTLEPVRGLTFQGYSDDSCWSRGHAWGILGFPVAYSQTKDKTLAALHKNITYYTLNHLPDDFIPKWDYHFVNEEKQPRDSSAGAISICGMLEMCKYLPESSEVRKVYESAAAQMMEAIIDKCTGDIGKDYDGLIYHVTGALPQGMSIDECAIYGDYFYMEALMRYLQPTWEFFWL